MPKSCEHFLKTLGTTRVYLPFEISDLKMGDTILFLPAEESFKEEGREFLVEDPTCGQLKYKLRSGKWAEAEIMEIGLGDSGCFRFRFRDDARKAWQYSEFGPVRVAVIERPSVIEANIKELERLGILTP